MPLFLRPLPPVEALLVHEYGKWTMPGGAVDLGEASVDTMWREVWEEVGVTLDPSFHPLCVGGWNQPEARDGMINDHYLYFVVKAADTEFKVDGVEIHKARWFDIDFLLEILRSRFSQEELESPHLHASVLPSQHPGLKRDVELDGELYSEVMLWFLHNYRRGRWLNLLQRRVMKYGVDRYYFL